MFRYHRVSSRAYYGGTVVQNAPTGGPDEPTISRECNMPYVISGEVLVGLSKACKWFPIAERRPCIPASLHRLQQFYWVCRRKEPVQTDRSNYRGLMSFTVTSSSLR